LIETGTIIAERYEIVRLIGEGGMGEVYEARHVHIGKRVALKVLNKDYAKDDEALERFHREARIASTIGHAGICEVSDFGTSDRGQPFLVMEYLDGESLSALIEREGRVPVERSLDIMRQVLDALDEAHEKGIVHRDLKPENVYLAEVKGQGQVVKLLDFGISKVRSSNQDSMKLTRTGAMVGTPYYMSPEQVRAVPDVDHRADIYACGVMLYEMVTGRVPYGGTVFNLIVISIIEDPFPEPRPEDEVPEDVLDLLRRSMARDREERIPDAATFQEQVEAVLKSHATGKSREVSTTPMATETTVPEPDSREGRGRSGLLVAGLVTVSVAILVVLGAIAAVIAGGRGPGAGEETSPERATAALGATTGGETDRSEARDPDDAAPGQDGGEEATAGHEEADAGGATPGGEAPASASGPEPGETDATPLPQDGTVVITVENIPTKGWVSWKGEQYSDGRIEVDYGTEPIKFKVSAPGHQTRWFVVEPDGDKTLDGTLDPDDKIAGKGGKKGKKPSHDWDYPG